MTIAIVYATNSGGTYIAAQIIQKVLEQHGEHAELYNALHTEPEEVVDSDVLVLGSPSWLVDDKQGQPHEAMGKFLQVLGQYNLAQKPIALFGLGDNSYAFFCGAVDIMEAFVQRVNAQLVAPSLRVDEFYFKQELNQECIQKWAEQLSSQIRTVHSQKKSTTKIPRTLHKSKFATGAGMAVGAGVGAALGSIAVGLVIGLAIGYGIAHARHKQKIKNNS